MNIKDEFDNWIFSDKSAFETFKNYECLWTQVEKFLSKRFLQISQL